MTYRKQAFKYAQLFVCLIACTLGQCVPYASGQQSIKPITKDNLISSLKLGRREGKTAARYIELIKQYGVNFLITPEDEQKIRRAGAYLGSEGLNNLIAAIHDNYRPRNGGFYADVTLYEENRTFPGSQYPNALIELRLESTLKYSYERTGGRLWVKYEMPYLSLLSKGGPIEPMYDLLGSPRWYWQFPKLAIKAVNNTPQTVMFTEAAVTVKSSEVIKEPVLFINPGFYYFKGRDSGVTPLGAFHIINEGWSDVVNAVVDLQISSPDYFPELHGLKKTFQLGTFSDLATINIFSNPPRHGEGCDQRDKVGWPFEYVMVNGEIRYANENNERRAVKFQTPIRVKYCGGLLGASHEIASYDVELEAGKSGYIKYVPLAQEVKPGETDYFLIRLGTDKTARFDLTFSFRTPGMQIPDKNITIEIFIPRSPVYDPHKARQRIK